MLWIQKAKGFTLIELLVVVGIIGLLVSIMVPAVQVAMARAKDQVVRAQLASIELGLNLFKGDFGDYPSSYDAVRPGAQLLSDAMAGQNLKGYEYNVNGNPMQKDPYITVGDIEFKDFSPTGPTEASYVMKCKWGEPILYYAAARGARATWVISRIDDPQQGIYDARDNDALFAVYDSGRHANKPDLLADSANKTVIHPDLTGSYNYGGYGNFYNFILNPQIPLDSVTDSPCPYKVDGFILISAGQDGEYGTDDDLTNFK